MQNMTGEQTAVSGVERPTEATSQSRAPNLADEKITSQQTKIVHHQQEEHAHASPTPKPGNNQSNDPRKNNWQNQANIQNLTNAPIPQMQLNSHQQAFNSAYFSAVDMMLKHQKRELEENMPLNEVEVPGKRSGIRAAEHVIMRIEEVRETIKVVKDLLGNDSNDPTKNIMDKIGKFTEGMDDIKKVTGKIAEANPENQAVKGIENFAEKTVEGTENMLKTLTPRSKPGAGAGAGAEDAEKLEQAAQMGQMAMKLGMGMG